MGSQRENHFVNLERRRDREGSVHTTMVAIDADQELLLVSISRMLKITTLSTETRVHYLKAKETMQ